MKDTMKSVSNTIDNSRAINQQLHQDGETLNKTEKTQGKTGRNLDKCEKMMKSKNSFGGFMKGLVFGFNGKKQKDDKTGT